MGIASETFRAVLRDKCWSFDADGKIRWTGNAVNAFTKTAFGYYGGEIVLRNGPRILRAMNTVKKEMEDSHGQ